MPGAWLAAALSTTISPVPRQIPRRGGGRQGLAASVPWALLLLPAALFAQSAAEPPQVTLVTRPPLEGLEVYVDEELRGTTDRDGRLVLGTVTPGEHLIRLQEDGLDKGIGFFEFSETGIESDDEPNSYAPLEGFELTMGLEVAAPFPEAAGDPPPTEPPPGEQPPPSQSRPDAGAPTWLYGVIGLGIALLSVVLVTVVRRGRQPRPAGPGDAGTVTPSPTPLPVLTSPVAPVGNLTAEQAPPQIGGDYRIIGLINSGGRGSVFLAESVSSGTRYAVKVPRLDGDDEQEALRAFLEEAEKSKRLLNSHVITVFEAGQDAAGQQPYYLMEYFDGVSLREYLRRFGRLSEQAAVQAVMLRVLDGLHYAHQKQPPFVHGDLKPENVMVQSDPQGAIIQVKLIDFGLTFGKQGAFSGTPPYVAPEVLEGEPVSPASDLFAVGVMLVELLVGRPPFWADSIKEMKGKILEETVDLSGVAAPLRPVIARLLEKKRDNRYQSAEEVILDGRQALFSLSG